MARLMVRLLSRVAAIVLALGACDGGEPEPTPLPPLVSEGAVRLELVAGTIALAEGAREAQAFVGPLPEARADLLSLTVMVTGRPEGRLALDVRDAAGRQLVEGASPEFSLNRVLAGRGIVTVQLPVASGALPLIPPFEVTVVRRGSPLPAESLGLRVWAKYPHVPATVPRAQALPLHIIDAGGGVPPERLAPALARARAIWRTGGLELVETKTSRLAEGEGPLFAPLEIDPALGSDSPQLQRLLQRLTPSGLDDDDGVPLFVVSDVRLGREGRLWAITGGVPVPPVSGTARSGLVVSAALFAQESRFAGQIIAHELGHALGLFHTTEGPLQQEEAQAPTAIADGLDDTPVCPPRADTDRSGTLDAHECEAHDASNLMFWATRRGAITLTPAQGDVARRSVLTR